MKFGFYTDVHLMGSTPPRRKDDFPVVILQKIDEVYESCQSENVEFMLFGGDLFDKHRVYSYEVLIGFLGILWKYKIKTYFVVGQHDLYGYNKDSYTKSALNFVTKCSRDYFVPISNKVELGDCEVYSCHVYNDFEEKVKSAETNDKFKILIAHKLLNDQVEMFDTVLTKNVEKNDFNLILSGDLHKGYAFHESKGTSYYNPGSLARLKYNDHNKNRDVKFGVFTVEKSKGEYEINLKEHFVKSAKPIGETFVEDEYVVEIEREVDLDVDKFVEEFEKFEKESINVFQLIDLVGKAEKVDSELLEYIRSFRNNDN